MPHFEPSSIFLRARVQNRRAPKVHPFENVTAPSVLKISFSILAYILRVGISSSLPNFNTLPTSGREKSRFLVLPKVGHVTYFDFAGFPEMKTCSTTTPVSMRLNLTGMHQKEKNSDDGLLGSRG
jgi:hypothetical protein